MIDHEASAALARRANDQLYRVRYPGYTLVARVAHGGVMLHGEYLEPDATKPAGPPVQQRTRQWRLSPEMTASEILQTAFKCVLTSAEHRVREHFKVDGQPVYSPHYDVEDLLGLCRRGRSAAGGRT